DQYQYIMEKRRKNWQKLWWDPGVNRKTTAAIRRAINSKVAKKEGTLKKEDIEKFFKEIYELKQSRTKTNDQTQPHLDITLEDVKEAIKKMKKNKSPGPSGITAEFIQTFSEYLAPILLEEFKFILQHDEFDT